MKRIILSAMVLAFAVAVQAGDCTNCQAKAKDTAGCCCHKMKTSEQAEGTCPFAKSACCKQASAKKTSVRQPVLLSPKAADLAW